MFTDNNHIHYSIQLYAWHNKHIKIIPFTGIQIHMILNKIDCKYKNNDKNTISMPKSYETKTMKKTKTKKERKTVREEILEIKM